MSKITRPETAEHYLWGEACDGWHLLKSPGLSVIQERVPQGCGEVRHYHRHAQQFSYILAGEATFEPDGKVLQLQPHQGCAVEPGVPHRLSNHGGEDLVFLVVSAPMSHDDKVPVD